jgi:hypothetical protein
MMTTRRPDGTPRVAAVGESEISGRADLCRVMPDGTGKLRDLEFDPHIAPAYYKTTHMGVDLGIGIGSWRLGGAATLVVLACDDDRGCDGRGHLPDGVRARLRHAGDRGPRRGVTPPAPESASGQWLDAENTGAACRHIDGALVDERTHRPQGGGKWRAASRASRGRSGRYPPVRPQPRCFP